MKKILLAVLIIITANVQAQAPQGIAFQAIARNLNGSPIANHNLQVRFSVLDSAANGAAVYVETHSTTTNTLGLFSLNVGLGTAVTNTFSIINWGKNNKFLKTEIDADGTGNWLDLGTQQMMSVPYALYAGTANNTTNGFKHYIGEYYGGGVVFSVYKDSVGAEHGLIVASKDVDTGRYAWSNITSTAMGSIAQSHYDGKANTQAIISQAGHTTSAAYMCDTSTLNGYTDWYLPAINEFKELKTNFYIINKVINKVNSQPLFYTPTYYSLWTSTEESNNYATLVFYEWSTSGGTTLKTNLNKIRAIRSF